MMLEIDGIETFYGETQALFGASLAIDHGAVVCLLGANGAGRTTTIRSILGLTPARSGSIVFNGNEITHSPTHRIARMGISWIPNDRRIFPTLTVEKNLRIARKKTPYRAWSIGDVQEIFSALEYLMSRDCEHLSGGEMQMAAISRALVGAPRLVLFDEPSRGLAPKVVQDVMQTIDRLKDEGISCLVVEQNAISALEVSDRVYVMSRGKVVYQGLASELREDESKRSELLGI